MSAVRWRSAAAALGCITLGASLLAAPHRVAAGTAVVRRAPARILIQTDPSGPAAPGEPVLLQGWVEKTRAGGPAAPISWSVAAVPSGGASAPSGGASAPSGGAPAPAGGASAPAGGASAPRDVTPPPPAGATIRSRSADAAVFRAPHPGIYRVTARSGTAVRHLRVRVYGRPAAVTVTPSRDRLIADGRQTDGLQVQVVDRRGVRVAGFVGDVALKDSLGQFCQSGGSPDRARVRLDGGEGSVALCAPSLPLAQTDRVTSADLEAAGLPAAAPVAGIRYGKADVRDLPATAAHLALTPLWGGVRRVVARGAAGQIAIGPTYLSADGSHRVTLSLSVEDRAGDPVGGARPVTVSLSGPGSLSPTATVTRRTLNQPAGAPFAVYSEAGQAGTIRVSARSPGLPRATYRVQAVLAGVPAHLLVLISRGFDHRGMPYNLYDVMVVGANRRPIPNAGGTIEVSDGSAALPTADPLADRYGRATASILYAPGSAASDAGAYRPAAPGAEVPFPLTDGSAVFAIETGAAGTAPARLTIFAPGYGYTLRPHYVWAAGRPAAALLSASQGARRVRCRDAGCRIATEAGQPVTVFAQVTDAHGNPLDRAGLPVLFALRSAAAAGGAHFVGQGTAGSRWALTNAHGVASVEVAGSMQGSPAFVVAAWFDQRSAPAGAVAVTVTGASR